VAARLTGGGSRPPAGAIKRRCIGLREGSWLPPGTWLADRSRWQQPAGVPKRRKKGWPVSGPTCWAGAGRSGQGRVRPVQGGAPHARRLARRWRASWCTSRPLGSAAAMPQTSTTSPFRTRSKAHPGPVGLRPRPSRPPQTRRRGAVPPCHASCARRWIRRRPELRVGAAPTSCTSPPRPTNDCVAATIC
jgi:hypothetical protein